MEQKHNHDANSSKDLAALLESINDKPKVLAVDDSAVILKSVSTALNKEYKVYGITNPLLVAKFLKDNTPDLFLLDYKMPEMSGFDLLPIIRAFPEHADTPIIFLTSEGTRNHVSAAYKLGANDFIVKPFQGKNLRDKVAFHLAQKKPLQE
jgi:PleD family two-component response regulator